MGARSRRGASAAREWTRTTSSLQFSPPHDLTDRTDHPHYPRVLVAAAVKKAKEAASEYAGASVGVRVEEVERLSDSAWNITLSWLEEDTVKLIEARSDPLRRMRLVPAPMPLERVYRVFEVRDEEPVRMKRAPEP